MEKEYLPKSNIKLEWYNNLMDLLSEEEFNTILKNLPNEKESEIYLISYI